MAIETLQPGIEPTRTVKLWTPNTIGAFTFFLGFPSGITLASINWFKIGMKWKAFANILIGIVGIVVIYFIPENPTRSVALVINLGFVAYIRHQMEADIDLLTDYKAENAHWGSGFLYSLLGWAIIIVIAASAFFLEPLIPGTSSYYYNRGNGYLDNGDFKNAITSYTQAVELDPENIYSYINRGYIYIQLGDFDLAIADFDKAIELNPDETLAYINRGVAYRETGRHGDAITDYTSAIRLNPNGIDAYFGRAYVYMQINDFNGAIPNYSKIIQIDQNNADAYYMRGVAQEALGQVDEAKADFEKALEVAIDLKLRQEIMKELQKLKEQ